MSGTAIVIVGAVVIVAIGFYGWCWLHAAGECNRRGRL